MTAKADRLKAAREARAAKASARESIQVTDAMRIREVDDRNWGVEVAVGKGWRVAGYYSCLHGALRGAARRLLDQEHRGGLSDAQYLRTLAGWLEGCEARVLEAVSAVRPLSETD